MPPSKSEPPDSSVEATVAARGKASRPTPRPSAPSSGLTMPVAFGRYELVKLLAVGGMAEVFLARTKTSGADRRCVIKRVLPRFSENREFVSMFIDEARITVGLDHENIVRLFDFGQVHGDYYMALEYVEGCDLVAVLRARKGEGKGVPPVIAAYIARCVLRGLHHAHSLKDSAGRSMGVVHRDVSPQNVFLGNDGAVKMGDFGIADAKGKLSSTMHGTVKGKFGYMSPEQTHGKFLDGRSDVFAVGVVLWEMLAGARLFSGESPIETMALVSEAPIVSPDELRAEVEADLAAITLRALARPPNERFASASDMADALDAYLLRVDPAHGHQQAAALSAFLAAQKLPGDHTQKKQAERQREADELTVSLPPDAALRALHATLKRGGNLWTLVEIGDRLLAMQQSTSGVAAIRLAALLLASRGLVVPAICAARVLDSAIPDGELRALLEDLATMRDAEPKAAREMIKAADTADLLKFVPGAASADVESHTDVRLSSPLFGQLTHGDFVKLALLSHVEKRTAGQIIVGEGDPGDALFAVGHGRVVVYCAGATEGNTPPQRVYVSSLSDGDVFGEFSLLTRRPRSATVEAATDTTLLRVDRQVLDDLLFGDASFRGPLAAFYKERVVELLLARNSLTSSLSPEDRRALLDGTVVRRFRDQSLIIEEGQSSRELFLILSGEVEVFHVENGFPVFLDKLVDGQIFGEMAAIEERPRMASVRAIGDVEVLVLDAAQVNTVIGRDAETRARFKSTISVRAAATQARIAETARIFAEV